MKIKCRRRENLQSEDCELIGKGERERKEEEEKEVKERRNLVKS